MRTVKHNKSGFSLVEVILALAIFSMAIGGVLGILVSSSRSVGEVSERSISVNVLREAVAFVEAQLVKNPSYDVLSAFASPMEFTIEGVIADGGSGVLNDPYYVVVLKNSDDIVSNEIGIGVTLEVQWPKSTTNVNLRSKQTLKHVFLYP